VDKLKELYWEIAGSHDGCITTETLMKKGLYIDTRDKKPQGNSSSNNKINNATTVTDRATRSIEFATRETCSELDEAEPILNYGTDSGRK